MKDLLAEASYDNVLNSMTQRINLMLVGALPTAINKISFGDRLEKKDGGVRPIAKGYSIRRLAAKCANHYDIKKSEGLKPIHLGVEIRREVK